MTKSMYTEGSTVIVYRMHYKRNVFSLEGKEVHVSDGNRKIIPQEGDSIAGDSASCCAL